MGRAAGGASQGDGSGRAQRPASRPAYQLLADRLHDQILAGEIAPGERLPGEADLCEAHGVSRSTVREAIRLLEAQHLVVTTRGTTGGSFVARHSPDRIGNELGASLDLLIAHDTLTVAQIIEARRLLEVPVAALAAARRTDEQLETMRQCLDEGREGNERFHRLLLAASQNPLLEEMTAPLFGVIHDRVERDRAGDDFWDQVEHDHRELLELIERRDSEGAAAAMGRHLGVLQLGYRIAGEE